MIPQNNFLQHTLNHPEHLPAEAFELANQTKVEIWDTGVICFEPEQAGHKDIILSCATHGNETAPIEICNHLITELLEQRLEVAHRVLFLIANPPSILIEKRFVEENMNRLFCGAHSEGDVQNQERVRAGKLEEYVARFYAGGHTIEQVDAGEAQRIHYDLHTAIRESKNEKFAVYPFLHGRKHNRRELAFLSACGVDTVLLNESSTTTFSYYSSSTYHADAFTVELGKVRPFGQNDMTRFAATQQQLTELISEKQNTVADFDPNKADIYRIHKVINRTVEDFELGFGDDEKNFQDFPMGFVLARDGDIEHKVDMEGEAIVFPNAKVALGQRALLTVVPAKLDV